MGLSSKLYNRCRDTLLKCSECNNDTSLRAVFVTNELRPFRDRLPTAASKSERVDVSLSFLLDQHLSDGQPVLPIFLDALRDRYLEGDALRDALETLAEDIRAAWTPSVPASISIRPHRIAQTAHPRAIAQFHLYDLHLRERLILGS